LNYFANEGAGEFEMLNDEDDAGLESSPRLQGSAEGLGEFQIRIIDDPKNSVVNWNDEVETYGGRPERTQFYGAQVASTSLWEAKS
jgi:hypothetical protein